MDVIRRAAAIFDTVAVGVLHNPEKKGCFSVEQRMDMLKRACQGIPNVEVISYGGLLAQLTRETGISVVVRGVRGVNDLENETAMARINRQLNPALETLFLPASPEMGEISASMVRQLAAFGADLSTYVPKEALPVIRAAFQAP
ncbi:MAG: pantetheine-phosphate adenylyltransferase [Clostridia bacterium]|nr:pantetheine-phosphate adenylyltransferase [Clostridia bacterium]